MANINDYTGGASFQGGALKVTDTNVVNNLNVSKLQGKQPTDFIGTDNNVPTGTTGTFGLKQNGKTINVNNVSVGNTGVICSFDNTSKIKIGNIIIQSSDNNKGILIGLE